LDVMSPRAFKRTFGVKRYKSIARGMCPCPALSSKNSVHISPRSPPYQNIIPPTSTLKITQEKPEILSIASESF